MRNILGFFLIVITASLMSCNDKCNEGNLATPASFFVEIVDETSGELVFNIKVRSIRSSYWYISGRIGELCLAIYKNE